MRRWIALGLALATIAGGCSSTKEGASASDATVLERATSEAEFTAFGGIGEASVLGAPEGTELMLADADGRVVGSGKADALGSLVLYDVKPGAGYTVRHRTGDGNESTEAFAVLDAADTPPPSLYDSQTLVPGLNYVKMRDGVELAMTVRLPLGKQLADGPFPTVIEYSGYEVAPPHDFFADITARIANPDLPPDPLVPSSSTAVGSVLAPLVGFATVSVQIRGTGCSGGAFDLFDLPTIYDGYDAVETVAAQSWVRGQKVGMVGISYSGYSQLFVGGTRPPHLAALAPMSVTDDLYDGIGSPGGIFNTGFALGWLTGRESDAKPAPEGGQAWAKVLIEQGDEHCLANQRLHGQARDGLTILENEEFRAPWLYANRTPATWAAKIDVPMFLVGGMQDEQLSSHWTNVIPALAGNPDVWVTMYNGNHNDALQPTILSRWVEFLDIFVADQVPKIPEAVLSLSGLLYEQMANAPAPALEQARFSDAPDVATAKVEFSKDPRVRMLVDVGAGSLGGGALQPVGEIAWTAWPPTSVSATTYYLGDRASLTSTKPTKSSGSDTYESDPAARPEFSIDRSGAGGINDAAPSWNWTPIVAGKGLGYQTEPLTDDVVLAGPSSLDLFMSADGVDADVQVTLSEVRSDGQELYLGTGWLRASHRKIDESTSTPLLPRLTHLEADAEPLVPGKVVPIRVPIFPTFAQIRAGSRIRVTIVAPGGDRPEWRFRKADNSARHVTVIRTAAQPSALVLPVVSDLSSITPEPACGALRGQPCRAYVVASNGG